MINNIRQDYYRKQGQHKSGNNIGKALIFFEVSHEFAKGKYWPHDKNIKANPKNNDIFDKIKHKMRPLHKMKKLLINSIAQKLILYRSFL